MHHPSTIPSRTRRRGTAGLCAVAGLALLAGCGQASGTGAGSSTTPPVSTTTTASPTSSPTTAGSTNSTSSTTGPTSGSSSPTTGAAGPAGPVTSGSPGSPRSSATGGGGTAAAPLPTNATAYADELVRAWGAGDRARASRYALPDVIQKLFGHADPGGGHWKRTTAQGAAGTIYVTYVNQAGPGTLVVGVSNIALGQGQDRAVHDAKFS